jgi:hypothetical protein
MSASTQDIAYCARYLAVSNKEVKDLVGPTV